MPQETEDDQIHFRLPVGSNLHWILPDSYLGFGRHRKNKRLTNIPSTWTHTLIKNDKLKSCMNFLELGISIPWAVFITLADFFYTS